MLQKRTTAVRLRYSKGTVILSLWILWEQKGEWMYNCTHC